MRPQTHAFAAVAAVAAIASPCNGALLAPPAAIRVTRLPRCVRMVDPGTALEAARTVAVVPPEHTLATLGPDLLNTVMVATLGLMGAYLTQGTEAMPPPDSEPRVRRKRPRREEPARLQGSRWEEEDDFYPPDELGDVDDLYY